MKSLENITKILEAHKAELAAKYHVSEIGIFGSFVRGEQKKRSDVDLLVEFKDIITLLDFVGLENYLSELLGIKVDLVMKSALRPRIGKRILEEVVMV